MVLWRHTGNPHPAARRTASGPSRNTPRATASGAGPAQQGDGCAPAGLAGFPDHPRDELAWSLQAGRASWPPATSIAAGADQQLARVLQAGIGDLLDSWPWPPSAWSSDCAHWHPQWQHGSVSFRSGKPDWRWSVVASFATLPAGQDARPRQATGREWRSAMCPPRIPSALPQRQWCSTVMIDKI